MCIYKKNERKKFRTSEIKNLLFTKVTKLLLQFKVLMYSLPLGVIRLKQTKTKQDIPQPS